MTHKTLRGRIHYTSDKPERKGQERGREWFSITRHPNGCRTLTAHSEIDDEPAVIRDVIQSYGPDFRPIDAAVRLTVGGEFVGSSWFKFRGNEAECEGYTNLEGRVSQRMALDGPITAFGSHPIQGDAWHLNQVDVTQGPGRQQVTNVLMSSLDHRGATGPMLIPHPKGLNLLYIGEETITVGAGTFDAYHFCYGEREDSGDTENKPGKHPPYEIWTSADGDYVFLQAFVSGYMMTRYELVELERL